MQLIYKKFLKMFEIKCQKSFVNKAMLSLKVFQNVKKNNVLIKNH